MPWNHKKEKRKITWNSLPYRSGPDAHWVAHKLPSLPLNHCKWESYHTHYTALTGQSQPPLSTSHQHQRQWSRKRFDFLLGNLYQKSNWTRNHQSPASNSLHRRPFSTPPSFFRHQSSSVFPTTHTRTRRDFALTRCGDHHSRGDSLSVTARV